MKIKHLVIMLIWFSLSAVIAFSATVSIILKDRIKFEHMSMVENTARIQLSNYELLVKLDDDFEHFRESINAFEQIIGNDEADEFFKVYRKNRPDKNTVIIPETLDLTEIHELSSESLKKLTISTVIFCIAGVALTALTARIAIKANDKKDGGL
ncbi:MAG: hypothetical protein FWF94_03305 [Oscillospiraceae bacterium]|nr:hypothetical protein [Oscillospiraceae bacterium]